MDVQVAIEDLGELLDGLSIASKVGERVEASFTELPERPKVELLLVSKDDQWYVEGVRGVGKDAILVQTYRVLARQFRDAGHLSFGLRKTDKDDYVSTSISAEDFCGCVKNTYDDLEGTR
jgi:hypothetical protein